MYAPTVFFSCFALFSRALRKARVVRKIILSFLTCSFGNGGLPILLFMVSLYKPYDKISRTFFTILKSFFSRSTAAVPPQDSGRPARSAPPAVRPLSSGRTGSARKRSGLWLPHAASKARVRLVFGFRCSWTLTRCLRRPRYDRAAPLSVRRSRAMVLSELLRSLFIVLKKGCRRSPAGNSPNRSTRLRAARRSLC